MTFLDIQFILPEVFLACVAMFLLIAGVSKKEEREKIRSMLKFSLFSLIIAAFLVNGFQDVSQSIKLNKLFILDGFAVYMKTLVMIASFFILYMSFDLVRARDSRIVVEFPVLVLLAVVGMMVMISANDLMSLYMGLELQSLSLYVLAASRRDSEKASEAGLKYFMLGALASGILLYGCSLIYGFTGTTNFSDLRIITNSAEISVGVVVGMVFVIIGICFKVSAVPFHMWTPDVYEGVPKVVAAFFATAPKVAALAVFVRFAEQPFGEAISNWQQIVVFVSLASMFVGSFAALRQTNIKRLIAYSSIGHVGFILVGLVGGASSEGVTAVLIYVAIYVVMNLGVFACIMLMKRKGQSLEMISDLSGLARYRPMMAAFMAILMLSMAGVPPMAGFFGKLFVFKAAVAAGYYGLAVAGVLASVVAAFYYLKIIKVMYFDEGKEKIDCEFTGELKAVLSASALFNLAFFIFPTPLLEAAKLAATSIFL